MEEKPFLKRMFSSNGNIKVFSIYRIYNGGNILSHFDFIPESLLRLGNKILRVIEQDSIVLSTGKSRWLKLCVKELQSRLGAHKYEV